MFAVEVGGAGASAALCAPDNGRAVDVGGADASVVSNPALGVPSLKVSPVPLPTTLGKGGVATRAGVVLCAGVALLTVGFKACAAKSPLVKLLPAGSTGAPGRMELGLGMPEADWLI